MGPGSASATAAATAPASSEAVGDVGMPAASSESAHPGLAVAVSALREGMSVCGDVEATLR